LTLKLCAAKKAFACCVLFQGQLRFAIAIDTAVAVTKLHASGSQQNGAMLQHEQWNPIE
jgi:hypothetical protein